MIVRRILERLQIDKTLGYALIARVWHALSGPITIALVIRSLTPDETGIFYGIANVMGIQSLFELGLINVLIGHAGHAHSAFQDSTNDQDRHRAKARMSELIYASRRWFALASIGFAIIAIAFGWDSLSRAESQTPWLWPLVGIVIVNSFLIYFSPSLAILEGSGDRELIYRMGFYGRFVGSFAVWGALFFGLGIWALVVSAAVHAAWAAYISLVHRRQFFREFLHVDRSESKFTWRGDVLSAQWRAAIISGALFLATQNYTLILLRYSSEAEAGKLGMTMTITVAVQMLALAWVQTKFSVISSMHGSGKREEAGILWRSAAVISSTLLVAAFAILTGILALMPVVQPYVEPTLVSAGFKNPNLASRFISPLQCLVFGIGCFANHVMALQGLYVLARKANPLVYAAVSGLLVTAAAVWIGGRYFATDGVVYGYACSMLFVAMPLHTLAYVRFRARSTE